MRYVFIFFISLYRKYISPLKRPTCVFTPTCSAYSIMAYEKYGALYGTFLTVRRILRCHPFSKGGVDYP